MGGMGFLQGNKLFQGAFIKIINPTATLIGVRPLHRDFFLNRKGGLTLHIAIVHSLALKQSSTRAAYLILIQQSAGQLLGFAEASVVLRCVHCGH